MKKNCFVFSLTLFLFFTLYPAISHSTNFNFSLDYIFFEETDNGDGTSDVELRLRLINWTGDVSDLVISILSPVDNQIVYGTAPQVTAVTNKQDISLPVTLTVANIDVDHFKDVNFLHTKFDYNDSVGAPQSDYIDGHYDMTLMIPPLPKP